MYDVIIIGMGIAGVSAGIYSKQANLKILMFEGKMPGGILNNIDQVNNYPGLTVIKGYDFSENLLNQVNELNIPYKNEEVLKIEIKKDLKTVHTKNDKYETKNLILATGRKPKFLGLNNERDLLGRGLSTCALCDGMFYKDKDIIVVGGGNSALQEALYLSKIVNKIYLLVRKPHFAANEGLIKQVEKNAKIEVKFNSKIDKINEIDNKINNVLLNTGEKLLVAGVFIYVGYTPDNVLIENLAITDDKGYVIVNENFETKINGLYAVGDIVKKDLYQLVTAASDGAIAATHISKK